MKSNSSTSLPNIALKVLSDLGLYLSVIENNAYTRELDILSGSTIGQHTRHIIELYQCLIEQTTNSESIINYALRRRDYKIESLPDYAIRSLAEITEHLPNLNIAQFCSVNCEEHGSDNFVTTTIGRELVYNIEHTIHHLAIVKIALKSLMPALQLPDHFGVAPSTIRYRIEECAQ